VISQHIKMITESEYIMDNEVNLTVSWYAMKKKNTWSNHYQL